MYRRQFGFQAVIGEPLLGTEHILHLLHGPSGQELSQEKCGEHQVSFRLRQVALVLTMLAVASCLCSQRSCTRGCGCDRGCEDTPPVWMCCGLCTLCPSILFLLAYLALLHPYCSDEWAEWNFGPDPADCKFVPYILPGFPSPYFNIVSGF